MLRCVAAFAGALAVYLSNGETISSNDAVPNSLLAFRALADHRLDFDVLRPEFGNNYAFIEAPNGHLASLFPVGTGLVTAPIYGVLYAVRAASGQTTDIAAPTFEPIRMADEKLAAAVVAALAVALFFACASAIAGPVAATFATVAFAFGTETWMIGSQGLWQHGSVELVLLAMIAALLQAARRSASAAQTRWVFAAGATMGLLPVVRPTALIFAVAGAIFAARWFERRTLVALAAGVVLGLAPGIAWNESVYHSLVGGYAANARWYAPTFGSALTALGGLLVSPSRGILIFTPLVLASGFGFANAVRRHTPPARLLVMLSIASLVLVGNYACFSGWLGGDAYGPRFLTDAMPVAMLLLVYVVPTSRRAAIACAALLLWSVGVQAAGAYSGAAGPLWNEIPIGLAYAPERVWQLHDSQIERNLRAAYYHYIPDYPTGGARYASGFGGRVTAVEPIGAVRATPLAGRPGTALALAAHLQNTGMSRWFGYASAVYNSEARVRARIFDRRGNLVSEQGLYVEGNVAPGAPARAVGMLTLPTVAGAYALQCDVVALGAPVATTAQPFRIALAVGERLATTENTGVSR